MDEQEGIEEYFSGKNIFITGGTGFLGKVLIEKLLRSCSRVGNIYILVRGKEGQTGQERLNELISSKIFHKLKSSNPEILSSKLHAVEGDVSQDRLGLSDSLYSELTEEINVVVHLAASIKFNDPLKLATEVNIVGTKRLMDMALDIKNLEVFVHTSTAYANCVRSEIKETYYRPAIKWNNLLNIMENTDRATFEILSSKILGDYPNTYAFTKAIAEDLVWDYRQKMPIVIMRPSVVISSWEEPLPGWADSLFGIIGIAFGAAKGLFKVVYTDPDAHAAYIPVDSATKATLAAVWYRHQHPESKDEDHIYNITYAQSVQNREILKYCMDYLKERPLSGIKWNISIRQTDNWFIFLIMFYFRQLLPAFGIDAYLKLIGKNPRVYKIQKRYYKGMKLIGWFLIRKWKFHVDNFTRLDNVILAKDRPEFAPNMSILEPKEYMKTALEGGRKYLLKEPPGSPLQGWIRAKLFLYLDRTLMGVQIGIFSLTLLGLYSYF